MEEEKKLIRLIAELPAATQRSGRNPTKFIVCGYTYNSHRLHEFL